MADNILGRIEDLHNKVDKIDERLKKIENWKIKANVYVGIFSMLLGSGLTWFLLFVLGKITGG